MRLSHVLIVLMLLTALVPQSGRAAPLTMEVGLFLKPPSSEPGMDFDAEGTVVFMKGEEPIPLEGAWVNVSVLKADSPQFVNTTTDASGKYIAHLVAPLSEGTFTVNVTAGYNDYRGHAEQDFEVHEPLPDLYFPADAMEFSNPSPKTGETIAINATVANKGRTAGNGFVNIYDGKEAQGHLIGSAQVSVPLEGSDIASVDWICTSGYHDIYAVITNVTPGDADASNQVTHLSVRVSDISPPVFLELEQMPLFPTSLDKVNVTVSVEDDIGLNKTDPVAFYLWVDGTGIDIEVEALGGGNYSVQIPEYPAGSSIEYTFTAVDLSGNKAETEKQGYLVEYAFITIDPDRTSILCNINQGIWVNGTVLLDGYVEADGATVEAWFNYTGSAGNWSTTADGSGDFSFLLTSPDDSGSYRVRLKASAVGLYAENEDVIVKVEKRVPDIVVYAEGISYHYVEKGGPVELMGVVKNRGELAGTTTVSFYDGTPSPETLIGQSKLELEPGSRRVVTVEWNATPGIHSIFVSASEAEMEEDLLNNIASREITIPETLPTTSVISSSDDTSWDRDLFEDLVFAQWILILALLGAVAHARIKLKKNRREGA